MPGLTLLNIDRDHEGSQNIVEDLEILVEEIKAFTKKFDSDAPAARLIPLKMKLKQLQDVISQFGSDGSLDVNEKQSIIMKLHLDLQLLSNNLGRFAGPYSDVTEICSNYLLNHLCTTAAVDPQATVIGVSNVLAQVLSKDITIVDEIKFDLEPGNPNYFDKFAQEFNNYLTIAGLFSAPVLGLPDIPMSQLGSWADQALTQLAALNKFIDEHYNPEVFYLIEKEVRATPFDTSSDILSFYIYENEFFAALIARADLLSGIEFPGEFTSNKENVTLQSIEKINELLSDSIEQNCKKIDDHLNTIFDMYETGVIDYNDDPRDHKHIMSYLLEAKLWRNIAKFAKIMNVLFKGEFDSYKIDEDFRREILLYLEDKDDIPLIRKEPSDLELDMIYTLLTFLDLIYEKFPKAKEIEVDTFIKSSDFVKFRYFLFFPIHILAAHDIFLGLEIIWTPWLLEHLGRFFLESAARYNPGAALEVGVTSIMVGLLSKTDVLIERGANILKMAKTYLEFQTHHLLAIEVLTILSITALEKNDFVEVVDDVNAKISNFLANTEVSPNSMLFQRANLYLAMLSMYQSSEEFLRKEEERYVSLDVFSWLQVPKDFRPIFPYIPLNTSLDNLSAG